MRDIDLRESWNRLSAEYQRTNRIDTRAAHYGTLAPGEDQLNLLGDICGKSILEIGCGGGQYSVSFALSGAKCVGVDMSDSQIDYAICLADQEGAVVDFHRAEMIAYMEGLAESSFDIVFSAYALQYVENLDGCFSHVWRILQPGGLFVFSLDHPLSDITEFRNGAVVLNQSYFDRGRMEWTWDTVESKPGLPFYSFHRTIGDFANLLADAGFIIERMIEPEPTDNGIWQVSEGDIERYAKVPATIIIKARKWQECSGHLR